MDNIHMLFTSINRNMEIIRICKSFSLKQSTVSKLRQISKCTPNWLLLLEDWRCLSAICFYPNGDYQVKLNDSSIVAYHCPNYEDLEKGKRTGCLVRRSNSPNLIEEISPKKFSNVHLIGHSLGTHVADENCAQSNVLSESSEKFSLTAIFEKIFNEIIRDHVVGGLWIKDIQVPFAFISMGVIELN
uniref:Lipase domain-containing protein n=1 Tax=Tetranychus urticae TaxID=32264 RepID=T1JQJ8_TETUR